MDAVIRRLETSTGEGVVPEAALDLLRGMCSDPPEVGECAVCFDFLAHPVLTHCNHVYCYECLMTVVSTSGARGASCPTCRTLLNTRERPLTRLCPPERCSEEGQGLAEKGEADDRDEEGASVGFDGDGVKVTWLLQHIAECRARRPEYKVVVTSHFAHVFKIVIGALRA